MLDLKFSNKLWRHLTRVRWRSTDELVVEDLQIIVGHDDHMAEGLGVTLNGFGLTHHCSSYVM